MSARVYRILAGALLVGIIGVPVWHLTRERPRPEERAGGIPEKGIPGPESAARIASGDRNLLDQSGSERARSSADDTVARLAAHNPFAVPRAARLSPAEVEWLKNRDYRGMSEAAVERILGPPRHDAEVHRYNPEFRMFGPPPPRLIKGDPWKATQYAVGIEWEVILFYVPPAVYSRMTGRTAGTEEWIVLKQVVDGINTAY